MDTHSHSSTLPRRTTLVQVGGALGIAATFLALAVFVLALFGNLGALTLSPLPLILGGLGMVLTIIGAVLVPHGGDSDTQPLAALFTSLFGVVGGYFLVVFWTWAGAAATAAAAAAPVAH
jgi:hypothetical protein